MTTDERASFAILSLYLATFCVITFLYWDPLWTKLVGIASAVCGALLFMAAFFHPESRAHPSSLHPLRSYMFSLFYVLSTLFLLRFVGGLISSYALSATFLYAGIIVALVVFRKAMLQVVSTMAALLFLFVTFSNLDAVLDRRIRLVDTFRHCGDVVFRIGPIQDVKNILVAGSYMAYLNRIDYRDSQINMLASKMVADLNDDEVRKTRALLDFVSNDIKYVSDPDDGLEYAKDPIMTLVAGAGDCEDQTLLLCSLLESVGLHSFIALTDDHVFALVCFSARNVDLAAKPFGFIGDKPCYALDPADPNAVIGVANARPADVKRVFEVRSKSVARFVPST